jgi:hypothetical protein
MKTIRSEIGRRAALLLLVGAGLGALPAQADSRNYLRMSFKVVTDGGDGPAYTNTFELITNMVKEANEVLDRQMRGLRLHLAEVVQINPFLIPPRLVVQHTNLSSRYYYTNQMYNFYRWWAGNSAPDSFWGYYTNNPSTMVWINPVDDLVGMFWNMVAKNPDEFAVRNDCANLYLVWPGLAGGRGRFPGGDAQANNHFLICAPDASLFLHEFGHFVNLDHPFETVEGSQRDAVGTESPDIPDTPPDAWELTANVLAGANSPIQPRWDQLAARMYRGTNYAMLAEDDGRGRHPRAQVRVMDAIGFLRGWGTNTPFATWQVEELWLTWVNLLSYHKGEPFIEDWRYSDMQLDRLTDTLNADAPVGRHAIMAGLTRFVGGAYADDANSGRYSSEAKRTVRNALSSVTLGENNILVIRPGHYNERFTTTNRVSLRATRNGPVSIGKP